MKSKSDLVELGGPGSGRKPEGGAKPKPTSNRRRGSIQREQAVSGDKEALEVIKETQKEFDAIKESNPALAKALRFWSTNGYKDIRSLQQGKEKQIAKENLNLAKANTKELESNFDKLPSYEGPVTRELSGVDISKFKAGDTMTMDAHSSFTAKGKWGGGEKASVRLVVPANKSGKAIWGMSNLAEEMEVVVPKGTSYKIGKIVPGNPSEVHLEEAGGKSASDLSAIINEALNQPLGQRDKGGPGSGPKPGNGDKPRSGVRPSALNPNRKPSEYTEQPSSSNPGKPRAGVSIRDLFPKKENQTIEQLLISLRSPSKR